MRILLPFWLRVPERCFYQDFHLGIAEALQEFGHEAIRFPFAEIGPAQLEESKGLYKQLRAADVGAALDLACWAYGLSRVTLTGNQGESSPIFDAFGIPYVQWLFDQPCNQQLTGVMAKRHCALYPDRGHPQQVRLLYPHLKLTEAFVPPAVRPENNRSAVKWSSARDIDVLYVGNLVPQALERCWGDPARRPDTYNSQFCNALADAVLENPDRPLHLAAQSLITQIGPMPEGFNLRLHLSAIEHFHRHTIRHDAILALARSGVRMRVVGEGWDRIALPANVELAQKTDYDGLFRLAGQAKICLDASTYLDGANDRVFSYAVNRAVCFTNASGYLRESAGEDGGIRFFSLRNLAELPQQVKSLLAQPASLEEAGERAAATVLQGHTWRHRVPHVLGALRLALPC